MAKVSLIAPKLCLMAILVVQNTVTVLLGRYIRQSTRGPLFEISHFMVVAEFLKLLLSCLFEATLSNQSNRHAWNRLRSHTWDSPHEMLTMAIPAALYLVSNSLVYIAISNLSVPIFQVSNQFKLMVTAVTSVFMLRKRYSASQWVDLAIINFCIAVVVFEDSKGEGEKSGNSAVGLTAVALSNVLSSFAGVFFEKVVKSLHLKMPSLWVRNFQLALWSLFFALVKVLLLDNGRYGNFFDGFDLLVWCQIGLFTGGGFLVSAVIKYADCVMKTVAIGFSVVLSTIASTILYENRISFLAATSGATALIAIFLFANEEPRPSEFVISITKRDSDKFRRLIIYAFIITTGLAKFEFTPELSANLKRSSNSEQNLDYFPSDWNTTVLALDTLRSIQREVSERHFHEATHVLFDLRSYLGRRPVKYLEIGSYTGVSASLMLLHPFPTAVTMVDPCILDKTHFNGSQNQESTIRSNLRKLLNNTGKCASIRQWDLRVGFSPQALPSGESFDIIFIDGDHSTSGVWADYNGTIDLLRPGGFMVFDDYLDFSSSPEVKGAVDMIVKDTDLIPLGTFRNIHGIHPSCNQSFINEFVLQKSGRFTQSASEPLSSEPLKVGC